MDINQQCPCGSSLTYGLCCEPYISNNKKVPTAEALMRSRYSAYVVADVNYILETTHPKKRHLYKKNEIENWAKENHWIKLEILSATETTVSFKAHFLDPLFKPQIHYEKSTFEKIKDKWFYVSGIYMD